MHIPYISFIRFVGRLVFCKYCQSELYDYDSMKRCVPHLRPCLVVHKTKYTPFQNTRCVWNAGAPALEGP